MYQNNAAADLLSRGQQKLVVCALRLSQGRLLSELLDRSCVFLVDDLASELDALRCKALCLLLEELKCQVFVTCIDKQAMKDCWSAATPIKMFHVEHGTITAV